MHMQIHPNKKLGLFQKFKIVLFSLCFLFIISVVICVVAACLNPSLTHIFWTARQP